MQFRPFNNFWISMQGRNYMVLQDFGTHLYNITPNVGCLMTGMSPDARALVYRPSVSIGFYTLQMCVVLGMRKTPKPCVLLNCPMQKALFKGPNSWTHPLLLSAAKRVDLTSQRVRRKTGWMKTESQAAPKTRQCPGPERSQQNSRIRMPMKFPLVSQSSKEALVAHLFFLGVKRGDNGLIKKAYSRNSRFFLHLSLFLLPMGSSLLRSTTWPWSWQISRRPSASNAVSWEVAGFSLLLAVDGLQVYTQHAYMRPYGVSTMLWLGIDQQNREPPVKWVAQMGCWFVERC